MKIGELAKLAGCKVVTVRYYEKMGLMAAPARTGANYRSYGREDVERLIFLRHCRRHGMSLAETAELVKLAEAGSGCCQRAHEILSAHVANIDQQIGELQRLRSSLQDMLSKCVRGDAEPCAALQGLRDAKSCAFCKECGKKPQ